MIEKAMPVLNWPEIPHTVDSLALAIGNKSGEDRIFCRMLHLQMATGQYVKGDTPEKVMALPYRARPDAGELLLQLPLDWAADPFKDANWCSSLNSCRFLDRFFNGYERTGNPEFLEFPLRALLDWHTYHIQSGQGEHAFALDDMAAGVRAARFAYIIDKVRSGKIPASPEDVRKAAEVLLFHWRLFVRDGYFKFNNHTISALHGFMSMAQVSNLGEVEKSRWLPVFSSIFSELVNRQFDDTGIHFENSPEYHFFALRLFDQLLRSGWYDEADGVFQEKLQLARQNVHWMRYPDGRVIPLGDTTSAPPPRPGILSAKEYTVQPQILNHSRYHISKTVEGDQWSFLAVKAGHQIKTHRHEDDLSFVWSESGHDIIVDPAKYAYTRSPIRNFIVSARAHNVIEFMLNGKSSRARTSRRLAEVTRHSGYIEVRLDAHLVEPEAYVDRRFFFVPGKAMLIIDQFSSRDADSFTSRVHYGSDFELDLSNGIVATDDRGACVHTAVWASVPVTTRAVKGVDQPKLEGWISRGYRKITPCPVLAISGTKAQGRIAISHSIGAATQLSVDQQDQLIWSYGDRRVVIKV